MLNHEYRIERVRKSLRWFEDDVPLLNIRVKELSRERQDSARKFAAAVIGRTRAELIKLLEEQTVQFNNSQSSDEPQRS